MLAWALKRLGGCVAVLFVVTLATFLVLHVIPGDAAALALGTDATPERLAAVREAMGTDRPLPEQYLSWIGGALTGDWGTSSQYGAPVLDVVAGALPVTLELAAYATLLALAVSLPLGVAAALRPGSALDVAARTLMQLASAMPGFWLAVLLMLLFSARLGWFPVSGYVAPSQGGWLESLCSLTLPAVVLAVGECGPLVRLVRSSALSSLRRGYMLSARAKGLPRGQAVRRYALRGALVAPLTMAGMQLAKLLGGTAVVESVFALPGLGRLLLTSVEQRDVMLLQGIVLFVTCAVVLTTFVTDVLVMAADPSIRAAGGEEGR